MFLEHIEFWDIITRYGPIFQWNYGWSIKENVKSLKVTQIYGWLLWTKGWKCIWEEYCRVHLSWRLSKQIPWGSSWGDKKSQITESPLLVPNFRGQMPSLMMNLTKVESLDLSKNQLSGEIPRQLNYKPDIPCCNEPLM